MVDDAGAIRNTQSSSFLHIKKKKHSKAFEGPFVISPIIEEKKEKYKPMQQKNRENRKIHNPKFHNRKCGKTERVLSNQ